MGVHRPKEREPMAMASGSNGLHVPKFPQRFPNPPCARPEPSSMPPVGGRYNGKERRAARPSSAPCRSRRALACTASWLCRDPTPWRLLPRNRTPKRIPRQQYGSRPPIVAQIKKKGEKSVVFGPYPLPGVAERKCVPRRSLANRPPLGRAWWRERLKKCSYPLSRLTLVLTHKDIFI